MKEILLKRDGNSFVVNQTDNKRNVAMICDLIDSFTKVLEFTLMLENSSTIELQISTLVGVAFIQIHSTNLHF